MHTRPATFEDLPAITELNRAWDAAWLGSPENSEDEVREDLVRARPLAEQSHLVYDGDTLLGAGWWWRTDSTLLVHPDTAAVSVRGELLDWFAAGSAPHVLALGTDAELRAALDERGWRPSHSAFSLIRAVTPDWVLDRPVWDDGIDVRPLRPEDIEAIHRLVYEDAGWADVPGHVARGLEEWRSLFATETAPVDQQVLAWQDDRLIGVAIGRIFSDGTGWVSQLAVSAAARRRGLGRALLLEAFARRRAAGARALGLDVQAANDAALELYLGVGLRIEREWLTFHRPAR
ncbi:MAG: GNAT family N-acetyltransferase [Actinomycetota bacterium]|nr:GNAT family N-acetyltransferase [Actinomycetota bacterium]